MKKTVVLGVTSGIAAYKSLDLVKELRKEDIDIFVVMTRSAVKMVNPGEFERASGNKVYTDLFEENFDYKNILKAKKVDHIDLADRADVICISPATANTIAKIANGIADDFLTTMLLAANSPVILAPSMNVHMWNNPNTQENIRKLKSLGFIIIPPERGMLACGYEGPGRLPHVLTIKNEILRQVSYSSSLAGKKIIVTAGGTIEPIDAARVIANNSSGKMGIALADECSLRGAEVILLRSLTSVEPRYVMKQEVFKTTDDLEMLLRKYISSADIIFHAAAVSDFKPVAVSDKIKSDSDQVLKLIPQKKLINEIKKQNPKIQLIGFKAISATDEKELIKKGKEKLQEANADAIIVNDISRQDRGFQADDNEVFIVTKQQVKKIHIKSKRQVAQEILDYLFIPLPQKP